MFRKGGDVTFLVDELKAVFDPRGGYWQPGGKFMPSIIAELGYVIEKHLQTIGLLRKAGAGRAPEEADRREARRVRGAHQAERCLRQVTFPRRARSCAAKCSTAAVVMMDGCMTCLNCGDSKCG